MRVLIIGSLAGELGRAAAIAATRGARLDQCDDVTAGLLRLRRDAYINLVLCELGQEIGRLVRSLSHERIAVPVVACGLESESEAALLAIREGAQDFLPLPPDPDLIAAILEAAAGQTHHVIARDPVMLAALRRAEQVAGATASVLITGESGTGKEVIARHIHQRSPRAQAPFIALNCAAIPEHLLESELFGHERGAFSGAAGRRIGKFEAANGGTLLLDEISEMDLRLQAKLLRAIQEREIDRLGGASPVKVDVRILATSNRDLAAHAASGRFRSDLFFRLNVINLELPPLRARTGDIAALAEHYAKHYSTLNALPQRRLTDDAIACLVGYAWPGNVRELENLMHRAVLLAEGLEIDASLLDLPASRPQPRVAAPEASGVTGLVGRRMDDVEQALIIETLRHTFGNRTHAATILGISIRALRNKLRDYAGQGLAVPPPTAGTWAA
ncbi:sigma-54 interaction domain-containing protein [Lichenicoccus sp.]|uniref:sigma-54 interaction domain-containing protein n=1 Tax=Lichenicoccus sp. TaxID=2781899 RepID=UPI003D0DF7F9